LIKVKKSKIEIPQDIISFAYKLKELTPIHTARSTRGGWTSGNVSNEVPLLAKFNVLSSWFCINPVGAYNEWHNHSGIPASGVIYIQTPNNSGDIEFRDGEKILTITPYPGLMIQFPGDVEHRVTVNNSNQDRICLVLNIKNYFKIEGK
jgi:hypothetical protein